MRLMTLAGRGPKPGMSCARWTASIRLPMLPSGPHRGPNGCTSMAPPVMAGCGCISPSWRARDRRRRGHGSLLCGRVFRPADIAELARIPGVRAARGGDGRIELSPTVTTDASREAGHGEVRAQASALELSLTFEASETVRTAMALAAPSVGQ